MTQIQPATPDRWNDVVDLFERPGPRGGTPFSHGCWCQYWHLRGKAYDEGWRGGGNKKRLETQVRGGAVPGLLAYVGGEPAGWCRVGQRESFERLAHSPKLAPVDDDPDVWSVVCFVVHPSARRDGVASALLEAAVRHAATGGARSVEGYAVRAGHHVIDSFTGYLPMFLAGGFEQVRAAGRRTVVSRSLA